MVVGTLDARTLLANKAVMAHATSRIQVCHLNIDPSPPSIGADVGKLSNGIGMPVTAIYALHEPAKGLAIGSKIYRLNQKAIGVEASEIHALLRQINDGIVTAHQRIDLGAVA